MTNVAEIGRKIADEIEEKGHMQVGKLNSPPEARCIITSTHWPWAGDAKRESFIIALSKKAGLKMGPMDNDYRRKLSNGHIALWNDTTDTSIVLETLRSL